MRISAKIRITACLGFVSFPEYLKRLGQESTPPVQLTPKENEVLSAPATVEELEQKLKDWPSVWENVQQQVLALPLEKQKEGELFLNNLAQYFQQMQKALSQIKQIQQENYPGEPPYAPWEEAAIKEWEKQQDETLKTAPQETTPKKRPSRKKRVKEPAAPPDPELLEWVQEMQKTPTSEEPVPEEPSAFEPHPRNLPTEEEEAKGKTPKKTKPEFAQSPEDVQQQKEKESDVSSIAAPTKKLEQNANELLDWIKKVPDVQVSQNPAKFKSDIAGTIENLVMGLNELKPTVDSLLEKYAF
jgi:hypothetical protein